MQKHSDWNDFLYFLRVAESKSLKAAARELGVNHSTVFRRIKGLEGRLDVRLFDRAQKGYTLTNSGEEIFQRAQEIEERMDSIHRTLVGRDIKLSGSLNISTTDTIGYYWLPTYIKRFNSLFPDILIDLNIQTHYTNLSKREADIVIPAVNIQPDYMVGRKLAPIYFRLYASQNYINKSGVPESTGEFSRHQFLLPNKTLARLSANEWIRKHINENNIVATSDKLSTLYKFAQQDLGIAPLPHYVAGNDASMVEIMELPDFCHRHVWILTHPDLINTARIRVFLQFMHKESKKDDRR